MKPTDIVLVTIDCARYDHILGGIARTPAIDSLRGHAVAFNRAYSQAASTIPALYSLFTSQYPHQHGHYTNLEYRPMGQRGLPGLLRAKGWTTAAFTGIYFLSETIGKLDFSTNDPIEPLPRVNDRLALGPTRIHSPRWRSPLAQKLLKPALYRLGLLKITRNATQTIDKAIHWLAGIEDKPFCLWVHLFDAHMVYHATPKWVRHYYPADPKRGSMRLTRQLDRENLWYVKESYGELFYQIFDKNYYPCRYRAALSFIDEQLARLIAMLKRIGRFDSSTLIVTADHGENLGEHGIYCTHKKLFRETTHVPLVIKFPGSSWKGSETNHLVEHVDVLPTVLDQLGVGAAGPLSGSSLLPLLSGHLPPKRFSFSEHEAGLQFAIRTDAHHYYWTDPQVPNPYPFAFETDLLTAADDAPIPITAGIHQEKARLRTQLTSRVLAARRWYLNLPEDPIDERLRALGYL